MILLNLVRTQSHIGGVRYEGLFCYIGAGTGIVSITLGAIRSGQAEQGGKLLTTDLGM